MKIAVYLETTPAARASVITESQWQDWFQAWLAMLQPQLSAQTHPQLSQLSPSRHLYELSLRLTGDTEIQDLNAQFRHQDKPTDVLAFAALEDPLSPEIYVALDQAGEPVYLGDVIISVETAQRQAETHQHDLSVELAWLAAHGLLHLLGWDHPDAASLERMLEQQRQLLLSTNIKISVKL